MKFLSTPKVQSLIAAINSLKIYTDWCLINGLVSDGQNHYCEITTEIICGCIDLNKFSKLIIPSRKVLMESINMLHNYTDKFLILGLYEGIPRRYLDEAKFSDLNEDGTALIINGKEFHISSQLRNIIDGCNDETEYVGYGKGGSRQYVDSEYIIKQTSEKSASNRGLVISQRLRKCEMQMGWNLQLIAKDIMESGRMEMIRKIMEDNNITVNTAVNQPYRAMHEEVYGKIQNITTYLATYGKFI